MSDWLMCDDVFTVLKKILVRSTNFSYQPIISQTFSTAPLFSLIMTYYTFKSISLLSWTFVKTYISWNIYASKKKWLNYEQNQRVRLFSHTNP